MTPRVPGEVCDQIRTFSSRAGISETGQRDKLVYTFFVSTTFCTQNGIVTQARITSDTDIVRPFDDRIKTISEVFSLPEGVAGGPRFFQTENVITEFCPNGPSDADSCKLFRHIFTIEIDARLSSPLDVNPQLFECRNQTCT